MSETLEFPTKVLIFVLLIVYIVYMLICFLASRGGSHSNFFPNSLSDVSKAYKVLMIPPVFVFSVWGVVFTFQLSWMLYAVTTIFRLPNIATNILSQEFYISFLLNICFMTVWLFIWVRKKPHASFMLTLMGQIMITISIGYALYDLKGFLDVNKNYCYDNVDVTMIRVVVHNALMLYATWTLFVATINIAVILVYYHSVSHRSASIFALVFLTVVAGLWFIMENSILINHAPYTFTVYIVLLIVFNGILLDVWGNDRTLRYITLALMVAAFLSLVARVLLISFRVNNSHCSKFYFRHNNETTSSMSVIT